MSHAANLGLELGLLRRTPHLLSTRDGAKIMIRCRSRVTGRGGIMSLAPRHLGEEACLFLFRVPRNHVI